VRLETFCRILDAEELARFKALGSTQRAEPHQCLFHEDDPTRFVYNLTRGTLKLYQLLPDGRRQIVGFVHAGDFLGLGADSAHAFTAEAIEASEYCSFAREPFLRFLDSHRGLARELYLTAAQELAEAREQMMVLGRKRADERLATFLLDLFDRTAGAATGKETVRLAMNRTDIADYLGLTKETVCRAFTTLRKAGLIALVPGNGVTLLQRRRLEALAGGDPH
jgi:CRP/FNR family transcriptional regulator